MTETRAAYNVGLRMPGSDVVLVVHVGRPWRCATGQHVLGQVIRVRNVRRLHLESGHVITGPAMVYCSDCHQLREWHAGEDGLREILESARRFGRLDRAESQG